MSEPSPGSTLEPRRQKEKRAPSLPGQAGGGRLISGSRLALPVVKVLFQRGRLCAFNLPLPPLL